MPTDDPAAGRSGTTVPSSAIGGRFELIGELGSGGMGSVYRARDTVSGEIIALKLLRSDLARDDSGLERFREELRMARSITHANVCRIHDLHVADGTAAISMELVEGDSLRHLLARVGPLSVQTAVRLMTDIGEAVREAHERGVVHRDLKPENIMVDRQGRAKVMDFGIAHRAGASAERAGAIVGTPAYMSPEQASGQHADQRSDIYALGLILFEMLTGRTPFTGPTTREMLRKHIEEPPPSLRSLDPALPEHLDRLVARCLEKAPANRLSSVAELMDALANPTAEIAIPVPPDLISWRRRDTVLLCLGALSLVYIFLIGEHLVPALQQPLQIDEIVAKREADKIASRLGYTIQVSEVALQYTARQYQDAAAAAMTPNLVTPYYSKRLSEIDLPVYWSVVFGSPAWQHGMEPEAGRIMLDRQGHLIEYARELSRGLTYLPQYKPPPVEQRRTIATRWAEEMCGEIKNAPVETAGGNWNASYSATWHARGTNDSAAVARVLLWAEQPYNIECRAALAVSPDIPPLREILQNVGRVVMVVMLLTSLVWFAMAQVQVVPMLKRRAPFAVAAGIGYILWATHADRALSNTPIPIRLGYAVIFATLLLIVMVAVENRLVAYRPSMLATWQLLLRGQVLAPGLAAAVVRGTLCGIILLGFQTIGAHYTSLSVPGMPVTAAAKALGRTLPKVAVIGGLPDPNPGVIALMSPVPALAAVAAAWFSGLLLAVVAAFILAIVSSRKRKAARAPFFLRYAGPVTVGWLTAMVMTWVCFGAGVPLGASVGVFGAAFVPALMGVGVLVILVEFDLLTAVVAAAVATFFTVNAEAMELLSEVDNSSQKVLFALCAVVLIGCTVVAFWAQLRVRLQQEKLGT
jgi:hypothetical protein